MDKLTKHAFSVALAVIAGATLVCSAEAQDSIFAYELGSEGNAELPEILVYNFEQGNLQGWQIVEGSFDLIVSDLQKSRINPEQDYPREGDYHLSTVDRSDYGFSDGFTGKVESPVFTLQSGAVSFMVGGGSSASTTVSIIRVAADLSETVVLTESGLNSETMRTVNADLSAEVGNNLFIRVTDNNTGGWGYVTLDGFNATAVVNNALTALRFPNPLADEIVSLEAMINDIKSHSPDYDAAGFLAELSEFTADAHAWDVVAFEDLKRRAALANPLLNKDPILFVVRKQYTQDHQNSENWYPNHEVNSAGYAACAGGSYLKKWDPQTGTVTTLLYAGEKGVLRDPDIHFDGNKFLFAWRKNIADEFHIYEMNVDGSGLRQLTSAAGVADGYPIYLPDDDIAFVSSREPKYIPCNRHRGANMYRMDSDGANIHRISNNLLHDNNLTLGPDGKIYYDRWEYLDRDFGSAQGIWSCNPDGTGHRLVFGNNTYTPNIIDARWIPGTQKFLAILSSCHDRAWGALAVIDNRLGTDLGGILRKENGKPIKDENGRKIRDKKALDHVWPAEYYDMVGEGGVDYTRDNLSVKYEDPYPLSENTFLVSRSTGDVLNGDLQTALYLVDTFGNEILLHSEAPGCYDPMPIRPRKRPIVIPNKRKFDNSHGSYYVENVNKGTHMDAIAEGEVKYVRVVETGEKRNWSQDVWHAAGYQGPAMNLGPLENRGIIGDAEVEADGSVFFNVPADKLVYFQLLDENKKMLQSMRSYITVQPGEIMGCVGCHDRPNASPEAYGSSYLQALAKPPQELVPWMGQAPEFFGFQKHIQPIFDAKCISCHDLPGSSGNDAASASVVLAGDTEFAFSASYISIHHKELHSGIGAAREEIFPAKSWGSHQSALVSKIEGGHGGLSAEEIEIIRAWVDLNSPYYPDYHAAYTNNPWGRSPLNYTELTKMLAPTAHTDPYAIKSTSRAITTGPLISYERPELSPILSGLSGAAYDNVINYLKIGKARLAASPQQGMVGFVRDATSQAREGFYQARWVEELAARTAILNGTKMYDPGVTGGDTTPPRITLVGPNPLLLTTASAEVPEPGFAAVDNFDGDLTQSVVRNAASVSTSIPGNYEITYDVTDAVGNQTVTVTRKVIVSSDPVSIYSGAAFVPYGVAVSEDESTAYIVGKGSSVLQVVDLDSGLQSTFVDLAFELSGIALGATKIYLSTEGAQAAVLVVDRASLALEEIIPGSLGGHAPVLSFDESLLYLCNKWSQSVSIFDLVNSEEVTAIPVAGEPSSAVISVDEQTLYVSHLLPVGSSIGNNDSSHVSVIDVASQTVTTEVPLPDGSHSLRDICLSPDGLYLLGVHNLGHHNLLTNQVDKGWQNTAHLAVIRLSGNKLMSDIILDDLHQGAANPCGIAFTGNGSHLAVSHTGTHELSLIDYDQLAVWLATLNPDDIIATVASSADFSVLAKMKSRISLKKTVADALGRGVSGMGPKAVLGLNDRIVVLEAFTDTLSIVDADTARVASRILLNSESDVSDIHQGYIAFNNAEFALQNWQSCSSCHPGGRSDGLSWDVLNDGIGNPKNTKSLLLSHFTSPIMSKGVVKDVAADISLGTENFMSTVRPEREHDNILAYLESLEPVPSPYLENEILSASAFAGKKLFKNANCASCHSGNLFTDQKMYDVGSGVGVDAGDPFDTPALIELWRTAPYMNDGSAGDLASLLAEHEGATGLSGSECADLAAYLLSLPESYSEPLEVTGLNFGFEAPALGAGVFQYSPAGASWTFGGSAGVGANGSAFGIVNSPEGTQVAILQGNGWIEQDINIPVDGYYRIMLQTAQRPATTQTLSLSLNGSEIMQFTPEGTAWEQVVTSNLLLNTGTYTLRFDGLNPLGGDNTAFIDEVIIMQVDDYDYIAWEIDRGIVSGPLSDDDSDGLPNLMEYALGGLPNNGGDGSLLSPSITQEAGNSISFTFNKAVTGLTYIVEYSTDLSEWIMVPSGIYPPGDTSTGEQVFDIPYADKLFVRLRVEE